MQETWSLVQVTVNAGRHGVGSMQEDMVFVIGKGQCRKTWCLLLVKVNVGRHGVCYW